jgi:hypothetical protein
MNIIYLYALVAFAYSEPVAKHGTQTVGYYATIAECQIAKNKIEDSADKSYVKLDCVPLKVE